MQKMIFMSSLPRSGSTLLCRILSQNPRIYASPTSALLDILLNTRNNWTTFLEHRAVPNNALTRVLKAMVNAYYEDIDKPIILDKSRAHNSYLDLWESILEYKPKVLITIRDLPDIIASMEKLHRKTGLTRLPPFEREFFWQMQHVEGRAAVWTMPEQIIGVAYNRITDALQRHPECLHVIHFDKLTKHPEETLKNIYRFLEEKPFEHDFNHIPTTNIENDDINGYIDLHETRAKVEWFPSEARKIIGDALVDKYSQYNLDTIFPNLIP